MAQDFHRTYVNDESFIRGAARLLWAGTTVTFPTKISDVINMSTYDAAALWSDFGATKGGIQISINATEEAFDVDQILTDLRVQPTSWECAVQANLAEMSLERLSIAWEGSPVTTDNTPGSGAEKQMGFGQPTSYTERKLAVLFQRPNGKIRAYIFRRVNRAAQESAVTYNKTGEQQTVPVRFKALPDTSVADTYSRFFIVRDQV